MTLKGFGFIVLSALFHVLWNSFLKTCRDKTSAIFVMMCITVAGLGAYIVFFHKTAFFFIPSAMYSALAAGFFFFLYQYFVAVSLEKGELTLVYPLTVTGPVYIVVWSYFLMDEIISPAGAAGIALIIYGAVTIQRGTLSIRPRFKQTSQKLPAGVLTALAASFFYSFGAVADKLGVMTGDILIYTFHLSLYMLIFHLARVIWQHQTLRVLSEIKHNPKSLLLGGMIMLLSFISFRLGLEEAQASYASALRQVSTLFGIAIGFLVFKEKVGLNRIISSMIIVAGAILIKIG
jgi:drug/metabolite transporter (DMT)-like permease